MRSVGVREDYDELHDWMFEWLNGVDDDENNNDDDDDDDGKKE